MDALRMRIIKNHHCSTVELFLLNNFGIGIKRSILQQQNSVYDHWLFKSLFLRQLLVSKPIEGFCLERLISWNCHFHHCWYRIVCILFYLIFDYSFWFFKLSFGKKITFFVNVSKIVHSIPFFINEIVHIYKLNWYWNMWTHIM